MSRAREHAIRRALRFHVVNHGNNAPIHDIASKSVQDAIGVTRWYVSNVLFLVEKQRKELGEGLKLIEVLQKTGGRSTNRELDSKGIKNRISLVEKSREGKPFRLFLSPVELSADLFLRKPIEKVSSQTGKTKRKPLLGVAPQE